MQLGKYFRKQKLKDSPFLGWLCSLNCLLWWKLNKTKDVAHQCYSWSETLFLACNQKDLGPMCFWSHGQSFPGKVSKMKVVEHLPNWKVGQVFDPYTYPLTLTQGREPQMGSGQLSSLEPPTLLRASEAKLACQEVKLQISQCNLTYFGAHLPCHLCPHNTLYYFNIMTRAMPCSPS